MAGSVRAPIYRIQDLVKRYNRRFTLHVSSLEIMQGQVTAIIGPNGAGKSTLLRILGLLEPPDSGDLQFQGQKAGYPVPLELRRQVSMVFQRPILLKGTVRQNVMTPLRFRGLHAGVEVDSILQRLDLVHLAGVSVRELSGGEYQRVALARALIPSPKVLLLDEPAANLDPQSVERIEAIIRAIRSEGETTVVLVTHHVLQAKRLADRTAMLMDGRVIEVGDTPQVFEAASDPRTSAFILGEMVY